MPRYTSPEALDGGPLYIKNNLAAVWLVPGYTTAMSYASADSAKVCAVAMSSTDATISASGSSRVLTLAAKSGTASGSSAAGDLSVVYVSASAILTAVEESSNQAITSGNPVSFPAASVTYTQPTA